MTKKYTRPFTATWRWLIAGASMSAFVGGWAILAHTPNPYENSASAATANAPVLEQVAPVPNTNQVPIQNSQRNRRQRQFQQLPAQGFDTAPQTQPDSQNQLPSTRTFGQRRMRTGGS